MAIMMLFLSKIIITIMLTLSLLFRLSITTIMIIMLILDLLVE